MNVTFSFISIFLSIILPGIIFKRIFYFGEFSKQFTRNEPVLRTILSALIPGMIIQILCFLIYNWKFDDIDITYLINLYKVIGNQDMLLGIDGGVSVQPDSINIYLVYLSFVFLVSVVVSFFLVRVIRLTKFDVKNKLLRFSNQWYYLFSSEILNFKKFKKHKTKKRSKLDAFLFTHVDVMIEEAGEKSLYSGLLVDYDLDPKDINYLDKIYLSEPHIWKLNNGKYVKKSIPSDVFVLLTEKILNINVLYIFKKVKPRKKDIRSSYFKAYRSTIFMLYVLLVPLIFFQISSIDLDIYKFYFSRTNFLEKMLFLLWFLYFFNVVVPFRNNEAKQILFIGFREFTLKVFLYILSFILLTWYFVEIPYLYLFLC